LRRENRTAGSGSTTKTVHAQPKKQKSSRRIPGTGRSTTASACTAAVPIARGCRNRADRDRRISQERPSLRGRRGSRPAGSNAPTIGRGARRGTASVRRRRSQAKDRRRRRMPLDRTDFAQDPYDRARIENRPARTQCHRAGTSPPRARGCLPRSRNLGPQPLIFARRCPARKRQPTGQLKSYTYDKRSLFKIA
jgi:hypothetical protein